VEYKRLWILVEGNDDEKLVEKIKHVFEKKRIRHLTTLCQRYDSVL